METEHWQISGTNPGAKVFPSCSESREACCGFPAESEERRVLERRRTVRTADLSRFQPPVSRLRGAKVSVSVLRGEGGLSGDISSGSHTQWSTADLSSCTTARSCEADCASFPTSVVRAIVGALGCAFFKIFFICFSFHLLSLPLNICVFWGEKEHNNDAKKTGERRSAAWVDLDRCFWRCSRYLLLLAVRSAGWLQLDRRLAAPLLTLCSSRAELTAQTFYERWRSGYPNFPFTHTHKKNCLDYMRGSQTGARGTLFPCKTGLIIRINVLLLFKWQKWQLEGKMAKKKDNPSVNLIMHSWCS